MPVLDGYEATRPIKADPAVNATPIIAVSSFAMRGDEEKARAAGCDHYVIKPYGPLPLWQKMNLPLGRVLAFDYRCAQSSTVCHPTMFITVFSYSCADIAGYEPQDSLSACMPSTRLAF